MAQELDPSLQSIDASSTSHSIISNYVLFATHVFASSSIFLLTISGPIDEPSLKRVQVFNASFLEPPFITSLLNIPSLSRPIDILHTQVMSSAAISSPLVSKSFQHQIFRSER